MSPLGTRGWLFEGAALDVTQADVDTPRGLSLTPAGRIAMVDGDAAVRQSIVMLLTTLPGERVMRPDYGCPLHRLMFAPNDATTAGLAIHYVRHALVRFEPRVEIVSLDARAAEDMDATLIVSLVYRIRATSRQANLEFAINLNAEPI
ncbi:MAG: GPW/gp25 family protein [Deinococcales bacterium]|jgi:uncharacterized protein